MLNKAILLDNSAVWHFEKNDIDSMKASVSAWRGLLRANNFGMMDWDSTNGVQRNITELLFSKMHFTQ